MYTHATRTRMRIYIQHTYVDAYNIHTYIHIAKNNLINEIKLQSYYQWLPGCVPEKVHIGINKTKCYVIIQLVKIYLLIRLPAYKY